MLVKNVKLSIPFAASAAAGCREAIDKLELPQLQKLLARLTPVAADQGDERSLSPPQERVLAAACGLSAEDGCIPWAAWQVRQEGGAAADDAWAWITPCHWHVATDHIVMNHPGELRLEAEPSQALLAAMQPYFSQDGITLQYDAPTRWLAHGELFRGLATASLDRVMGRDIDEWVPRAARAAPLRRLQQEMQMLLYTHPVNDNRTRDGLLPINSFWASGTGVLPADALAAPPAGLQMPQELREAALLEDWPAWAAAWRQIDARQCESLNQALDTGCDVTLTLCGEQNARSWSVPERGFIGRIRGLFGRQNLQVLFGTL